MDEWELLEIIEKASIDGRMILDLSFDQMTSVPEELGQLTNLTELNQVLLSSFGSIR